LRRPPPLVAPSCGFQHNQLSTEVEQCQLGARISGSPLDVFIHSPSQTYIRSYLRFPYSVPLAANVRFYSPSQHQTKGARQQTPLGSTFADGLLSRETESFRFATFALLSSERETHGCGDDQLCLEEFTFSDNLGIDLETPICLVRGFPSTSIESQADSEQCLYFPRSAHSTLQSLTAFLLRETYKRFLRSRLGRDWKRNLTLIFRTRRFVSHLPSPFHPDFTSFYKRKLTGRIIRLPSKNSSLNDSITHKLSPLYQYLPPKPPPNLLRQQRLKPTATLSRQCRK
jgi:hypothetical protein